MTREQIESALDAVGFSTGEWISLQDSFKYLLRHSDKNSFADDGAVQYYFSSEYDYFLTRHLTGTPTQTTLEAETPNGYAKVFRRGSYFLLKIEPGGVVDQSTDNAGIYHTLTSFASLVGFFKK
jgi:hypothetical protein